MYIYIYMCIYIYTHIYVYIYNYWSINYNMCVCVCLTVILVLIPVFSSWMIAIHKPSTATEVSSNVQTMHAGLQTSLGILEPEHLYPGTREFIGFNGFLKGTYGMLMDFYGILWEFHEFCRIEWEYAGDFHGIYDVDLE